MNLKTFKVASENNLKTISRNGLWLLIGLIIWKTCNTSQAAPIKPKAPTSKATKGKVPKTTPASGKPIAKAPLFPKVPLLQPTFTAPHDFLSKDGAMLRSVLVQDNVIYGVCSDGGKYTGGTIWRMGVDGKDFKVMHEFRTRGNANPEGANPTYMVWGDDGFLYGIATESGQGESGTIWRLGIDGNDFSLLHSFETVKRTNIPMDVDRNSDGYLQQPTLLLKADGTLVGLCLQGGPEGYGTIWQIKRDGNDFQVIHTFSAMMKIPGAMDRIVLVNDEGACPTSILLGSNGRLYGTTRAGGKGGEGIVFSCRDDGSDWQVVHTFEKQYVSSSNINRDGREAATIIESQGWLYGISSEGGWVKMPVNDSENGGTIWRMRLDGSEFKVLHTFVDYQRSILSRDGYRPFGKLFVSKDNWIYGTTKSGGLGDSYVGNGTCFRIRPDGSDFQIVYGFDKLPYDPNIELDHPMALLPLTTDGHLPGKVIYSEKRVKQSEKLFMTGPLP